MEDRLLKVAFNIVDNAEFESEKGKAVLSDKAREAVALAFDCGSKDFIANMIGEKVYLACYSRTYYVDYEQVVVFATFSKYRAERWAIKFNRMLKKWTKFYSDGSDRERVYANHRFSQLLRLSKAYVVEVELR